MQFVATIWDLVRDNAPAVLLSVLGVVAGAWWGRWRARRRWIRREFLHRLNVSLNALDEGFLRIRTVLEKDLLDVMLNSAAVEMVLAASQRTTEADPLLPLPEDDAWYLLNAVLNEISERFAHGLLERDLGAETRSGRYLLCLTNEIAGATRTHKVRAMLVRKDVLEHLPDERPRLESPRHSTRWDTLQRMAQAWRERPHLFLDIEIAV